MGTGGVILTSALVSAAVYFILTAVGVSIAVKVNRTNQLRAAA